MSLNNTLTKIYNPYPTELYSNLGTIFVNDEESYAPGNQIHLSKSELKLNRCKSCGANLNSFKCDYCGNNYGLHG